MAGDVPTLQLLDTRPVHPEDGRPAEIGPGTTLRSRYVLLEEIGRGGHCVVFSATDLNRTLPEDSADDRIAIKLARAAHRGDTWPLTLLKREFAHMQSLSHPNIVRVFDFDSDGDTWFISMELVSGVTLQSWARAPGNAARALPIIGACCEALEYAHSMNIVHGDIKPTNVLLMADGTIKLIDFGSVPRLGRARAATVEPVLAITPLHASPQVLMGQNAEPCDDVYSLACLSYFLLSGGRHPFGGHPAFEDGRIKTAPHALHDIPAEMFAVIERGLSADRARRPASALLYWKMLKAAEFKPVIQPAVAAAALRPVARAQRPAFSWLPPAWLAAMPALRGPRALPVAGGAALAVALLGATLALRVTGHRQTDKATQVASIALAVAPAAAAEAAPPVQPEPLTAPASARAAEVISFDAASLHVSPGQTMVAIPVTRSRDRRTSTFSWRIESGTALPGVDYKPIEPQLVRFHEGQSVRILYVPLLATGGAWQGRGPRTFTVTLQPLGGQALGRFARITATIESDAKPPGRVADNPPVDRTAPISNVAGYAPLHGR